MELDMYMNMSDITYKSELHPCHLCINGRDEFADASLQLTSLRMVNKCSVSCLLIQERGEN